MNLKALLALGVLVGVYGFAAFVYLPTGAYWTPDNGIKRIQAENLRFRPWPDLSLDYPGQWLDPELKYIPCALPICYRRGDQVHVAQPAVTAVLARPFLPWLGDRGGLIIPMLAGLISALWIGHLTQSLGLGPAWAGSLLAGLATPMLFYSVLWWEHTLAVALGLGALWFTLQLRDSVRTAFLAGVLAGLAGSARKEMLLFAVVLWGWLLIQTFSLSPPPRRRWSGLGVWLAGCVAALLPGWWVHVLNSGQLIPPEFMVSVVPQFTPEAYLLTHGFNSLADFLFDPRVAGVGNGLLILLLVYAASGWIRGADARAVVRVLALIGLSMGTLLLLIQRNPGSGLVGVLNVAPFLMLGLNASADDRHSVRAVLWITVTFWALASLNLGLFTSVGPRQSALEWGARFVLIIFPLGAPLAVAGLRMIRQQAHTLLTQLHFGAAMGLVVLSVVIQIAGLNEVRTTVLNRLVSRDAILAVPEQQVVSGQFWLPMLSPDVFLRKELFFVPGDDHLAQWAATAYTQGVRRWAHYRLQPLDQTRADQLAPAGARLTVVETIPLSDGRFITRLEFVPSP